MAVAPLYQLGILVVHGLGSQPSGDTLVHWGDVLVEAIARATSQQVAPIVEEARSREEYAEASIRLRSNTHSERWLLSEGWWAETFRAPSYGELVSWGVRALPWSIATHIAQRYWQTAPPVWNTKKLLAIVRASAQLLIAFALAPPLLVILGLILLLGLLPIQQLRTWSTTAQSVLTATVGDSLAFVESPLRAASIRTRLLDRMARLNRLCARTIVIAHSQGAALVLDALGGITAPNSPERADHVAIVSLATPDVLVTFGAGTNQLVSQKVLSAGLPKTFPINPATAALWSFLGAAVLSILLYVNVRYQRTTILNILVAAGELLLGCVVLSLLMLAIVKLVRSGRYSEKIINWTFVPLIVVGLIVAYWYADRSDVPLGSVNFLFLALMLLIGSTALILSQDMRTIVTAPVRKPAGIARWIDLYASDDLVPNGPTRTAPGTIVESVPVWNRGSILDHTTYWDNLDGFVLRIVRACAETAESPWKATLPSETVAVDRRAAWRVRCLQFARWSTVLVWLGAGATLWVRHSNHVPIPSALPDWLPIGIARFAVLATATVVAAWTTASLLRWIWSSWVRAEQGAVLAGNEAQDQGREWAAQLGMGMIVWLLVYAEYGLLQGDVVAVEALLAGDIRWIAALPWQSISHIPFAAFGISCMSTALLRGAFRKSLGGEIESGPTPRARAAP